MSETLISGSHAGENPRRCPRRKPADVCPPRGTDAAARDRAGASQPCRPRTGQMCRVSAREQQLRKRI